MTVYQTFIHLLYEAVCACEEVDRFDLDSQNPAQKARWDTLIDEQRAAIFHLVEYVQSQGDNIKRASEIT